MKSNKTKRNWTSNIGASVLPFIQACVSFYNDTPELLSKCLLSLQGKVDKILCVDGAYAEFPFDKPYSTDGSLDVAKVMADEVLECKEPYADQVTKRNTYLTLNNHPNAYYLYIDADEVFKGNIPLNLLKEKLYAISMEDYFQDGNMILTDRFRLFRATPGLQYKYCHAELWINEEPLLFRRMQKPYNILTEFTIEHHPYLRSQERQRKDAEYMAKRNEKPRLESPVNTLENEKRSDEVTLLLKGEFYSGADGFGGFITVRQGQKVNVSKKVAEGILESWPNEWETI